MARSSIYGNAIMPPKWAFGGEFGDLSQIMNQRDLNYEQVQQAEQINDQRGFVLDDLERKDRTREGMEARLGGQAPTSIREAYAQMADAAYQAGDPVAALEYQAKIDEYDQAQAGKQRKEIADALGMAPKLPYGRITELFPNAGITPEEYARNQARGGAGRKEKQYMMMDENGVVQLVPESEFNNKAKTGWKPQKSADPIQEMIAQALQGMGSDNAPGERPAQQQKDLVDGIGDSAKEINTSGRARLNSGDIATSDMKLRNPETGEVVTIKKGQRIP